MVFRVHNGFLWFHFSFSFFILGAILLSSLVPLRVLHCGLCHNYQSSLHTGGFLLRALPSVFHILVIWKEDAIKKLLLSVTNWDRSPLFRGIAVRSSWSCLPETMMRGLWHLVAVFLFFALNIVGWQGKVGFTKRGPFLFESILRVALVSTQMQQRKRNSFFSHPSPLPLSSSSSPTPTVIPLKKKK